MEKPWKCRLGWHKWVRRSAEDGTQFRQCERCKEDDGQGKIHWSAGGIG